MSKNYECQIAYFSKLRVQCTHKPLAPTALHKCQLSQTKYNSDHFLLKFSISNISNKNVPRTRRFYGYYLQSITANINWFYFYSDCAFIDLCAIPRTTLLLWTQFSEQKLKPCSKVKKFQNPFCKKKLK